MMMMMVVVVVMMMVVVVVVVVVMRRLLRVGGGPWTRVDCCWVIVQRIRLCGNLIRNASAMPRYMQPR